MTEKEQEILKEEKINIETSLEPKIETEEELEKYSNELWDKGSFAKTISKEESECKKDTIHKSYDEDMNFNCKKCNVKISAHNKDWHEEMCDKCFNERQLNYLINLLNQKLGLSLVIKYYKHKEGIMARIKVLAIDRAKVKEKFEELFKKYQFPECMYYKINLRPLKIKTKYYGKGQ